MEQVGRSTELTLLLAILWDKKNIGDETRLRTKRPNTVEC